MDDLDFGSTVRGYAAGQKVFERYTLRKILGRGGMGVVWLARDDELERDVALKFLPEVVALDKAALNDLKRETRRSLDLTHPHIVRIYDFVQDAAKTTAAISMEYVEGDTLAGLKTEQGEGHFEVADISAWLEQFAEALTYAHTRAEVVHRDLKPANLMINARGELKITDFGIAASVSDSVSRVSAQAGSSGTPVYMSPQQMMGEPPAVADDVYAFGATIYELLTGKPPFYSGNVMMQVMNKVPPSMTVRREELQVSGQPIPPAWEAVVARCLAKEGVDRPQSVAAVLAELSGPAPAPTAPAPAETASGTRGADLRKRIRLTREDMQIGGTFEVKVQRSDGEVVLQVKIPANIQVGNRIRLSGQGNPGTNGGEAGDLYLEIVEPKSPAEPPPIPEPAPQPQAAPTTEPEGAKAAKSKGGLTAGGIILLLFFILGLVGWGAVKFGRLDRFDKPTRDTVLVVSGDEQNITERTEEMSVNGFYRVKQAAGVLTVDGVDHAVSVRDRSFYSWGHVIRVTTNRLTGVTTSDAQPITVRVAAAIPGDARLRGRSGTLSLDLTMEIPVLEKNPGQDDTFREEELHWTKSVPVQVITSPVRPRSERIEQAAVILMLGCLAYGLIRWIIAVVSDRRSVRVTANLVVAGGCLWIGGQQFYEADQAYLREFERVRTLAQAEESLAQDKLSEARDMVEAVLDADPGNLEADTLLDRINAMPVTLRVPSDYASILEAMEAAKRGDTIEIAPGTYEGKVSVEKDVRIIGTGDEPGQVVLQVTNPDASGNVIAMAKDTIALVQNLTARHQGSMDEDSRPPVINVGAAGARLTLRDVVVEQGVGHGLSLDGGTQVEVYDSIFRNNTWSGVVVGKDSADGDKTRLTLAGQADYCYVEENGDHGIKVRLGGVADLAGAYFTNNASDGIRVESGGTVTADNVALFANRGRPLSADGAETQVTISHAMANNYEVTPIETTNGAQVVETDNDW